MHDNTLNIAIVGMGPRGLSVLERLVVRLGQEAAEAAAKAQQPRPVRIFTIDPGEHGAGRVWRTDQSEWLLMNTAAGEVSLYSGEADGGPWRAGAGPSLHQWLCSRPDEHPGLDSPNIYAPRRVYGTYLHDVYRRITAHLPESVTVVPVRARARWAKRGDERAYQLTTSTGEHLEADRVILTTGHPHNFAGGADRDLLDFASRHRGTTYLRGDSAADMGLDDLPARKPVAVIGLGLTFYDITAVLTTGRGGRFVERVNGRLTYLPSGHEPQIYAGSRSGLPLLARGRNQKGADYRYTPKFFTHEALADIRAQVLDETGSVKLRFREHVLPLMLREVDHAYYATHVRRRDGAEAATAFSAAYTEAVAEGAEALSKLLAESGLGSVPPIDLEGMARPFAGEHFASPEEFHTRLLGVLAHDAAEAELGNVDGPLKAALDILRDIRGVVREAVEFASLHPDSQRDEFLHWFNPINTMVSAGPPAIRIQQAIALIEAGILTVVGPGLEVGQCEDTGVFSLNSSQVDGAEITATTLIDARIPRADVRVDASPLMRQLIGDGCATTHTNISAQDGARFTTGALAVTDKPFRVIDAAGRPTKGLYALGIPTEELRWFTQIGNGRPGPMVGFHADADAIAVDILNAQDTPTAAPTEK
ncbi:FAD/NAD(P)-binding protein [Kitasatospora sp. NPDC002227]|uniref:FAD/NAD(P)-binding protein n=1 Tax=Kitasatospora sp. NPDC002227 TaxID=3154773 RepID=UPI003328E292